MGDRGNIKVKQHDGNNIWIYGHWAGYGMPLRLQGALQYAKSRWSDESYLTRCLITEVCKDAKDCTSFGVSTYPTDNEYDVLEVDSADQKVRVLDKTGFHDENTNWVRERRRVKAEWTFEDFCALKIVEKDPWRALRPVQVTA